MTVCLSLVQLKKLELIICIVHRSTDPDVCSVYLHVSELQLNLVLGGIAAVIHVWIFRSGGTGVLPLLAVVVLVVITVVVEPAVVVFGAVREELALRMVLTDGLAV